MLTINSSPVSVSLTIGDTNSPIYRINGDNLFPRHKMGIQIPYIERRESPKESTGRHKRIFFRRTPNILDVQFSQNNISAYVETTQSDNKTTIAYYHQRNRTKYIQMQMAPDSRGLWGYNEPQTEKEVRDGNPSVRCGPDPNG